MLVTKNVIRLLKVMVIAMVVMVPRTVLTAEETSGPSENSDPPQQFEGFDLTGYDESQKKSWDVQGDTADIVGSEVQLKNVNANSYGNEKNRY